MAAHDDLDVLVLGGGPAGSSMATHLARAGLRVLVCDKARHPRFHVGESLLPQSAPLLRELGVWERLETAGFQRKWGAHFMFEPDGGASNISFAGQLGSSPPQAFHVRRAIFDDVLLRNAASAGALVREGVEARRVLFDGKRAGGALVRDAQGRDEEIHARVVIDATGRDTLLGAQLALRERDPDLRQAALFSHYRGARMALGHEGGDILVVGGPVGWYWMIPLDAETTSVGIVFPGSVMAQRRGRPLEDFFAELLAASPEIHGRLDGAERIEPVHPIADFSYRLRRFSGPGWLAVGDAACFLDPVFSSGVHVALEMTRRAAPDVVRALRTKGRLDAGDLGAYEKFARRGLERFRRYILAYYDPAFVSIFTTEPPFEAARAAVVSALAGRCFRRPLRQRALEAFFFLAVERSRRQIARGKKAAPIAPARDRGGAGGRDVAASGMA